MLNDWEIFILSILCFSLYFLGSIIGSGIAAFEFKKNAVERGKAEYYFDKDYEKRWRWKE